jgi:hypothetical protein
MVLLQPGGGPSSSEIGDRRICVAVQRASKSRGDRVRESAAAYELGDGGDGRGSKQAVHTDIQALREVQEKFVVGNDPGLSRLATALVEYEVRINESFASDSHERWRAGIIVTSHLRGSSSIDPSQVFLLDYPDSWLEVAAGHVVDSSGIADQSTSPAAIFEDLKRDRLGRASEQLRLVCGLRLGEQTPLDRIRDLIDNVSGGQIVHDELARLLIH